MATTSSDPALFDAPSVLAASSADRYFDYCLEPYQPRRPWQGKWRGEELFWRSLELGRAKTSLSEPVLALQQSVGRDLSVWGVKWGGGRLWWELYYYDPQKEAPEATLSGLARTLSPWLRVTPSISEQTPYVMVSFDLDAESVAKGVVPEVNLYLTGGQGHAGRSYRVSEGKMELENTYRFMEPKRQIDELLPLLKASVYVDYSDPRLLSKVLFPELFACKKVCIAKKRYVDAIYFSGIAVEQLVWFFRRFAYPEALTEFVARHAERFEHLYFDVGIDYRWDPAKQALVYPKTSFYGTF